MKPLFMGSGVALVTPFHKDGKIDFDCFIKLIEFQITNNTDAIIVCGTTGEGSTLELSEKLKLFSTAKNVIGKRVPLIGGTGSNSTSFALKIAQQAEECGIDAHLIVTPYYNKASQKGIIEHYFYLADRLKKPIIVYNVPSRTGVNIKPETYEILSHHNNIIAVKEADPDIGKLIESINLTKGKLDFYLGNDDLIAPGTAVGCKGVISVLANILPHYTHEMAIAGTKNYSEISANMQSNVIDLIKALFSDVNPIPVKEAMDVLELCKNNFRLPLCSMKNDTKEKLLEVLKKHQKELSNESKIS